MQTRPEVLICRILGSDLPPRHCEGQTLANINFIFDHEELVEGVARRWILNRIWDRCAREQIVQVLSDRQETHHCIPFDRAHYLQQRLDATGLPRTFNPLKILNSPPQKYAELLALEWIYRYKSLAAINLNAARNTALELFLGEASWVLPLDGNVFMRRDGQAELLDVIGSNPKAKYIILPMVRFADNASVLNYRIERQQKDEPQIAFRSDSRDRFDERDWLRQFRDNWMWSKGGERAATAQNNIAVVNDLVIAAISAFLGDVPTSVWILNSAPLRLQSQIELYGTQPAELSRTRPLHYSLFSLQLWANLAKLGRSPGIVDLWQCGGSDHRSLAWAIRFLALNREHLCDYESDRVHFDQRIALLIHEVPQDGAEREVLPEWPTDVACDRLDHRDGISPVYAIMRMSSSKRNDAENSVLSGAHSSFDVADLGERRRSTAS